MAHLVFVLPEGKQVGFETEELPGPRPAGRLADAAAAAQASFEASIDSVTEMAGTLVAKLRRAMPEEPDEVEVKFGLKASGEVNGFLVAKGEANASFAIKLVWTKAHQSSPLQ